MHLAHEKKRDPKKSKTENAHELMVAADLHESIASVSASVAASAFGRQLLHCVEEHARLTLLAGREWTLKGGEGSTRTDTSSRFGFDFARSLLGQRATDTRTDTSSRFEFDFGRSLLRCAGVCLCLSISGMESETNSPDRKTRLGGKKRNVKNYKHANVTKMTAQIFWIAARTSGARCQKTKKKIAVCRSDSQSDRE